MKNKIPLLKETEKKNAGERIVYHPLTGNIDNLGFRPYPRITKNLINEEKH